MRDGSPIENYLRSEKLAASLAWLIAAATSFAAVATLPQTSAMPSVSLSVTDLSPKFLALYEEAVKEKASPDARWELLEEDVSFCGDSPDS